MNFGSDMIIFIPYSTWTYLNLIQTWTAKNIFYPFIFVSGQFQVRVKLCRRIFKGCFYNFIRNNNNQFTFFLHKTSKIFYCCFCKTNSLIAILNGFHTSFSSTKYFCKCVCFNFYGWDSGQVESNYTYFFFLFFFSIFFNRFIHKTQLQPPKQIKNIWFKSMIDFFLMGST